MLIGNAMCAACGKPIGFGQPCYFRIGASAEDKNFFHSGCGDPFFIKAKDIEIKRYRDGVKRALDYLVAKRLGPAEIILRNLLE